MATAGRSAGLLSADFVQPTYIPVITIVTNRQTKSHSNESNFPIILKPHKMHHSFKNGIVLSILLTKIGRSIIGKANSLFAFSLPGLNASSKDLGLRSKPYAMIFIQLTFSQTPAPVIG